MPDLKKVLAGLECCVLRDPDDKPRCSECSYDGNCVNRLKMDAHTLLRQQNEKIISLKRERAALKEALTEKRFPSFGVMGTAMPLIGPADKLTGEKVEMIMGEPLPEPPKEGT